MGMYGLTYLLTPKGCHALDGVILMVLGHARLIYLLCKIAELGSLPVVFDKVYVVIFRL